MITSTEQHNGVGRGVLRVPAHHHRFRPEMKLASVEGTPDGFPSGEGGYEGRPAY